MSGENTQGTGSGAGSGPGGGSGTGPGGGSGGSTGPGGSGGPQKRYRRTLAVLVVVALLLGDCVWTAR
jgi:hypothetical protein